jgi:quinoprotein glucose dehydrogenase
MTESRLHAMREEDGSMHKSVQDFRPLVTVTVVLLASIAAFAQRGATNGEWRTYGGDLGSTKYSPLDQINKANVTRLRIAWRRPSVDPSILAKVPDLRYADDFRTTPLFVEGVLYTPNAVGLVEAFDAGTGKTIWVQEPPESGPNAYVGVGTRGVAYWTDGADRRILVQRGQYLIALNAKTGKPYPTFGTGGRVDLQRYVTGPPGPDEIYRWRGAPTVVGDIVILGRSMSDTFMRKESPRGDVWAFDVRTGERKWTFNTIPRFGEFGTDSWDNGSWEYSGHANAWALFSVDTELGYVYMPVGAPTSDMYGGHRHGDNLFSTSLVCVEAATGKRVWHFQTSHHDLWDYDVPAPPILMDLVVDGRPIKAVAQITKQAFVFVFDRVTGKPVWPIEERPVPQSTTPGEKTSPTQPFPTRPPAFDRQGATEDNLIDFTPELRAEALEIVKRYTMGPMYTPPSVKTDSNLGTIQLPGSQGGGDVQGAAFDPETKYLYVPSITAPFVADIVKADPARGNLLYHQGTRMWMGGPRGLPLFKPPYGRITAFDMNKGEIVWQVPNGVGPRDHPAIRHLKLGRLGWPGRPSPLLTKTLLFIGEGSAVQVERNRVSPGMPIEIATKYGEPWFRAYDKETGAVVWETQLPAGTTGAPMTYMHQGKQYVVVPIGGTDVKSQFVAFSLP